MNDEKQINSIPNKVNSQVVKHEYLLIFLLIIGIALNFLNVQYGGIIAVVLLSTIALLYLLSSGAITDVAGVSPIDAFFYKLSAMACGISIIGILFEIYQWPNSKSMMVVGGLTLLASVVYILMQRKKRPHFKMFSNALIVRFVVLILIIVGLMFSEIVHI